MDKILLKNEQDFEDWRKLWTKMRYIIKGDDKPESYPCVLASTIEHVYNDDEDEVFYALIYPSDFEAK